MGIAFGLGVEWKKGMLRNGTLDVCEVQIISISQILLGLFWYIIECFICSIKFMFSHKINDYMSLCRYRWESMVE